MINLNRRNALLGAMGALTAPICALPALAQDSYPVGPVRMVVGFTAGTPPEIFARMLAERMAKSLKQPFIVENKPGAGSVIATAQVAKAKPDGTTLLLGVAAGLEAGRISSPMPITTHAPTLNRWVLCNAEPISSVSDRICPFARSRTWWTTLAPTRTN